MYFKYSAKERQFFFKLVMCCLQVSKRGNDRQDASDWRDKREGGERRMMSEGQRYGVRTGTGRVPRVAWVSCDSQGTLCLSFMRSSLGHEILRQ